VDPDARSSCLRAVRLVARSARLCASVDRVGYQYKAAVESAERMLERARKYYTEMKAGHAPHERAVRVVNSALVEAQICVRQMAAGLIDSNDLLCQAEKIERAIQRAEGPSSPPPPADSLPSRECVAQNGAARVCRCRIPCRMPNTVRSCRLHRSP